MSNQPIEIGLLQVATATTRADERTRVVKEGETFAVFDRFGDIRSTDSIEQEQGLYHRDTRFLSRLELTFGKGSRPLLLNSTITKDNTLLVIDLTNPGFCHEGDIAVPQDSVHLFRSKLLWKGACYEHLRIVNYGETPMVLPLHYHFAADFADIFEVRGTRRKNRGEILHRKSSAREVRLHYRGLDGNSRITRITFSESPVRLTPDEAEFRFLLPPGESRAITLTVHCRVEGEHHRSIPYEKALHHAVRKRALSLRKSCTLFTSNEQFNDWLNRSDADLQMLVTETEAGPYTFAGIPWFKRPLREGRDPDGLADPLDHPGDQPGRPPVSRQHAGPPGLRPQCRGTGKDPP